MEAYDTSTWKRIFPLDLNDRVDAFDAVFSPDGTLLATGGSDRKVHLWNLAEGRQSSSDAGHADSVVALAFSPDGRRLATGSLDKTIKVWDALSLRELLHDPRPRKGPFQARLLLGQFPAHFARGRPYGQGVGRGLRPGRSETRGPSGRRRGGCVQPRRPGVCLGLLSQGQSPQEPPAASAAVL